MRNGRADNREKHFCFSLSLAWRNRRSTGRHNTGQRQEKNRKCFCASSGGAYYQRRRGRDKERDRSPWEPENPRSAAPGSSPEATSPPPCPGCRLLPSWPDPHGPLWKGAALRAKEHNWAPLSPLGCLGKDSLKAVQVHCLGLEEPLPPRSARGRMEGTGAYKWQAPPFRAPIFSYRGNLSETSGG